MRQKSLGLIPGHMTLEHLQEAHIQQFQEVLVHMCACVVSPGLEMHATATQNLRVWLNGVLQPTSPNANIPFQADTFQIPANTQVIAMKCDDTPNFFNGFCMASFDNGLKTDASWKCSVDFEEGWMDVGFDDRAWWSAYTVLTNQDASEQPSGQLVTTIDPDAHWLSGIGYQNDTYCRKTFG